MPAEAGNKIFQDKKQGLNTLEETLNKLKPEATYFTEEWGKRTVVLVVDLPSVDMMPAVAEPFFRLNLDVEFHPAMVLSDLKKGLLR